MPISSSSITLSSSHQLSSASQDVGSLAEPHFAGRSPAHLIALRQVERYAEFEHATVLIEGETGTGKGYIAKYLHMKSPSARHGLHQVILSTLDDNLACSNLFGHLDGAYTGARQNRAGHFVTANKGTLFPDEIGKASSAVQRMLLHAIEHREIRPMGADRTIRLDVRLVAAMNIALEVLVSRETFLEDLAARLTTFRVRLPALRERRSDIPELVRQFVRLRASQCGHPIRPPEVSPGLMAALQSAEWPYNLRQLDGTVQRLLMEGSGHDQFALEHCVGDLAHLQGINPRSECMPTLELVCERMRELGSATATAKSLGISRWTVYRYLERARKIGGAGPDAIDGPTRRPPSH